MSDLRTQLRSYLEETSVPVDVEEMVTRQTDAPRSVRPLHRRMVTRWAVGLAAALAVILVVGGTALGIWLFAGSSDREVVQPVPSSTTMPEAVSWTTEWTRVALDEAVFGPAEAAWINDVTAGGPGLVAVGLVKDQASHMAAVWTSPDGYEWSVAFLEDQIKDEQGWIVEPMEMRSVTATESGLYAVGGGIYEYPDTGEEEGGWGGTGLVLTSPDGTNWTAVPDLAVFEDAELLDIVEGGPGLVAVGRQFGDGAEGLPIWVSVDGATWTRADVPESGYSVIAGVTVGGPGLVAVGSSWDGYSWDDAAVWTSQDGTVWDRVPHDETVFGGPGYQAMSSVTVGGPGLVAVGGDRGRAAVWTSTEGIRWSRIAHDIDVFGQELQLPWDRSIRDAIPELVIGGAHLMDEMPIPMHAVIASDFGLIAVGHQYPAVESGSGDRLTEANMWISRDGTTWSRMVVERHTAINGVAEGGPGLIAVGVHYGHSVAAVWVAGP